MGVPEQHQQRIARDTLEMPNALLAVMGGPSHAEARKILEGRMIRVLDDLACGLPKPDGNTLHTPLS